MFIVFIPFVGVGEAVVSLKAMLVVALRPGKSKLFLLYQMAWWKEKIQWITINSNNVLKERLMILNFWYDVGTCGKPAVSAFWIVKVSSIEFLQLTFFNAQYTYQGKRRAVRILFPARYCLKRMWSQRRLPLHELLFQSSLRSMYQMCPHLSW